jgi:hypothetical protein
LVGWAGVSGAGEHLPGAKDARSQAAPLVVEAPRPETRSLRIALAAEGLEPARPAELVASLRLPDLQTEAIIDIRILFPGGGRRQLRLSNMISNTGVVPLEVTGVLDPATRRTRVHQRVFTGGGAPLDFRVGEFTWHPGHQHWHIEDFAVYELWSVSASDELLEMVAASEKLSYCLIDTDVVAPDLSGFDRARDYRVCGRTRQGISIGWGDRYRSYLPGKSLDITGLPEGVYVLVSTVNPTGVLLEADYTNNTAVRYLLIQASKVVVLPSLHHDANTCQAQGRC